MFCPVSIALHARTIYVGMRGIVVEVHLETGTMAETRLAPVDPE
jgi:hypothetical protein